MTGPERLGYVYQLGREHGYQLGHAAGLEEGFAAGHRAAHDEVFAEWAGALDEEYQPETAYGDLLDRTPVQLGRPRSAAERAQMTAQCLATWGTVVG